MFAAQIIKYLSSNSKYESALHPEAFSPGEKPADFFNQHIKKHTLVCTFISNKCLLKMKLS